MYSPIVHILKDVSKKYNIHDDILQHISSYVELQIYYFPSDIRKYIMTFIPYHRKYSLNRYFYDKFHKNITFSPIMSHIQHVIKNDMDYVFQKMLHTNLDKWTKKKKMIYKKLKFDCYVEFLNNLCIEHHSHKCRNILRTYIQNPP